jgi:hypothetical protein
MVTIRRVAATIQDADEVVSDVRFLLDQLGTEYTYEVLDNHNEFVLLFHLCESEKSES